MYFLVSYELIDRDDLSLSQKMMALYLARVLDENSGNVNISETDLASVMKLSLEEVKLNIQVLVSKGLINLGDMSLDAPLIEFKSPVFKPFSSFTDDIKSKIDEAFGFELPLNKASMLYLKSGEDIDFLLSVVPDVKGSADPIEEAFYILQVLEHNSKSSDKEGAKRTEDLIELKVDSVEKPKENFDSDEAEDIESEIAAQIDSVEQRIKERAAKLRVRGLEDDNPKKDSATEESPEKSRVERPSESDELLEILAESIEKKPPRTRLQANRKKISPKDRAFMRASSVYKKTKKTKEEKKGAIKETTI